MDRARQRRLLAALVGVTVLLLAADLAGWGVAAGVRRAGAIAFGPVQRVLAGLPRDDLETENARLEADNVRLRAEAAGQARRLDELRRVTELLGADTTSSHPVVAARVVATSLSPLGGRGLTIDVGSRDGIHPDSTVVTAEGLVGRVVAVAPWTSDVQVLGSTGSVVAVRVGPSGLLGTVTAPSPGDRDPRARGSLTLSFVQPGTPEVGDVVRTLGSVDERPYAAGIVVGTVTSVDPDRGQLTRTATVRPVVDPDAVDIVAVVLPTARTVPRPTAPATRGSTP